MLFPQLLGAGMTKEYEGDYEFEEAFPTRIGAFGGQGVFPVPDEPQISSKVPEFNQVAEHSNLVSIAICRFGFYRPN